MGSGPVGPVHGSEVQSCRLDPVTSLARRGASASSAPAPAPRRNLPRDQQPPPASCRAPRDRSSPQGNSGS
jgi:hypothetical protein